MESSIKKENFKTPPGKAYFWSGRTNGAGGQDLAATVAKRNGGTTLEMLIEERGIPMPEYSLESEEVWRKASYWYAEQASGDVHALIGQKVRPDSVWKTTEFPALLDNKKVTRIIILDPQAEKERRHFEENSKTCADERTPDL